MAQGAVAKPRGTEEQTEKLSAGEPVQSGTSTPGAVGQQETSPEGERPAHALHLTPPTGRTD